MKTHRGRHNRFAEITKDDPDLRPWSSWLADAANTRHAGLYGDVEDIKAVQAQSIFEAAHEFIALIERRMAAE